MGISGGRVGAALGAVALLVAVVQVGPTSGRSNQTRAEAPVSVFEVVDLLAVQTAGGRFVDTEGRDLLLRGVNVNSLGEYWQGVAAIDPVIEVSEADWASMASRGFSVVRLIVSWSRIEPSRGAYDDSYLDQVDEAVKAAASYGIYTVIDMHQDAFTATISTAGPSSCPDGTRPAKGWDGAPGWATITDGLSDCLVGGDRNSSPAVQRAWNNFYDNRDGIRDAFVEMWGHVAQRFGGRTEVAGFDLLNEPETSRPSAELSPIYNEFLRDVIEEIRQSQSSASFDTVLIVEPAIPAGDRNNGLVIPDPSSVGVSTDNVAAGVHNYSESIDNGFTIEGMNELIAGFTESIGVPNWGGEYGWWDTSADSLAKARRYAASEDAFRWGGAWWQWRQSCGDPHHVQWSGGSLVSPAEDSVHMNRLACPSNTDLGPTNEFMDIVGRGYPRATPGRLVELRSDPENGYLKVKAQARRSGGELVVWTPTEDSPTHRINVQGLINVVSHEVAGGRLITATVERAGTYGLWVGTPDEDLSAPEPPSEGAGEPEATPAQPKAGTVSYTG